MFYSNLRKLVLPLCAFAALTASAGVFSPLPQTSALKNSSRSLSSGAVYTPKAVDKKGVMTPDFSTDAQYYASTNTTGTVLTPSGEEWFYTLELDGTRLNPGNPYYVDMDFTGFQLHVYDSKMNSKGHVKGNINRPEGTARCYGIEIVPQLTTSFFNTNSSDYEVMVSCTFNPDKAADGSPRYGAKETTQVYSITETVPATGSKLVFECPGYFASAINMSSSISEDYLMTFIEDTSWDGEDVAHSSFVLYKRSGYGTPAQEIKRFTINKLLVMADGNNDGLPIAIKRHGNDIYIATAVYEKTFLKDPTAVEPEQNPDNNFIITLYKKDGDDFVQQSVTTIPVGTAPEGYYYRSLALGNFLGFDDVTFDFGDGQNPCYIITIVDSDNTDNTTAQYVLYNSAGEQLGTFGEDSDSFVLFDASNKLPRQVGFYMTSSDDEYGFVVYDFPSLQETGFVPILFEYDADAWTLASVPARAMTAEGLRFVASVQPANDDVTSTYHYIGWFRPDGTLDHVDTIFLGNDTAKSLFYIHESVLDPYLFNTDKNSEYLAWVYRNINGGPATSLELDIINSKGEIIASRKLPGDHTYELATVCNTTSSPSIVISYKSNGTNDANPYKLEYIQLPLNAFEGEGTAASPYLIKTYGDLNRVRNNLTAHYRLSNSIDCGGQIFKPIEGDFTGTIDGGNFDILNLTIDGVAMFKKFGHYALYGEEVVTARLQNVNFVNPTVLYEIRGRYNTGVIAGDMNYAELVNVNLINPSIKSSVNIFFGGIAGYANNVSIRHSSVSGADFEAPAAVALGGLFADIRNGSISTVSVSGSIKGGTFVGGLIGKNDFGSLPITDCHVNAEISGTNYVGGVAGIWQREPIKRVFVEGSIEATDYVGGITGAIAIPDASIHEDSNHKIIDNCLVGLESLTVPSNAKYAHRIFGYSVLDLGDRLVWQPNPNNPETGEYIETPAAEESKMGTNYVVTELDAVKSSDLLSEGELNTFDIYDSDWLADLGYALADWASEASESTPWVYGNTSWMPELYFEETAGASLHIVDADVTGQVGETVIATLIAGNVDFDNLQVESSNTAVAELADLASGDNGEVNVHIQLNAAGTADITFTYGSMHRAVVHVTVKGNTPVLSFRNVSVEGEIGNMELVLDFDNTTLGEINATSSDESTVGISGIKESSNDKEALISLVLKKQGSAEITAKAGSASAKIVVTVKKTTGIDGVSVNLLSYNGYEVSGNGFAIEVFDMQGRKVAAGENVVNVENLVPGIYIVNAVKGDGTHATIKFNR